MADFSDLVGGAKVDVNDLRDEPYVPSFAVLPPKFYSKVLYDLTRSDARAMSLRNQTHSYDCVGQAPGALIDIQRRKQQGDKDHEFRASGRMLYKLANYYDSFGQHEVRKDDAPTLAAVVQTPADGVRTLRAAIKGFHHHGVCPAGDGPGTWSETDLDREWPSREQAATGEMCVIGGYRRLQPALNHHHSAIRETQAVLVSAMIHEGWLRPVDGQIPLTANERGVHAFLVVGSTDKGFLVLNSWGPDWGGFKVQVGDRSVPCPGVALWTYEDWSRNMRDCWVLRRGIPGLDAFGVTSDAALRAGLARAKQGQPGSTPYQDLRGNFLNLSDGRCVESGSYPTPAACVDDIPDGLEAEIRDRNTKGVVLRIPAILEPIGQGFARAVSAKRALARSDLLYFTCFWCADLSTEVGEILASIFRRASETAAPLRIISTAFSYERICRDVRGNFPDVTIICHAMTMPYRKAVAGLAGRWKAGGSLTGDFSAPSRWRWSISSTAP